MTLNVQSTPVEFKLDTGSQANIIPILVYKRINEPKASIQPSKTKLTSYTGDELEIIGKCTLHCRDKSLNFFESPKDQPPILGFQSSQELDIIKVVMSTKEEKDIKEKYRSVCQGLGCLCEPYHIEIDPEINPPRKIPVGIKGRLKVELDDMESQVVIRKVDRPTDWVLL